MGMFDYVKAPGYETDEDVSLFQSKDGPCALYLIDRDAVDNNGAYIINRYRGDGLEYRRGPDGWVEVSGTYETRFAEMRHGRPNPNKGENE